MCRNIHVCSRNPRCVSFLGRLSNDAPSCYKTTMQMKFLPWPLTKNAYLINSSVLIAIQLLNVLCTSNILHTQMRQLARSIITFKVFGLAQLLVIEFPIFNSVTIVASCLRIYCICFESIWTCILILSLWLRGKFRTSSLIYSIGRQGNILDVIWMGTKRGPIHFVVMH